MSGRVWKAVKAKAGKVRMVEVEGRGKEGRRRKETRKEREKEEGKEIKKDGGMKNSRKMRDLG